ncbi:hypothetical protein [Xenorhabdus szentirmaii]|uniref:Uncharacterized protein n=1 Tax=Xenorhabdus szentirmaii DSM 16338 TaxID=1427518 RepID=W1J394_9GAMM|nr:hypothetical protein [Xenorhabdus szentirmaii]PHM30402.1 hypothetical protein Xsze_04242 [Xenorhabdus szentirmaii DSM 16338]CDL85199.1 exported hypothetical protein [Xenorhabdus szentirmaii DSM 16338]
MKTLKMIMIISSFIFSILSINNANAYNCETGISGKITKITVDEDGRHFYASFGAYEKVPFWYNFQESEGQGTIDLLITALASNSTIEVIACYKNSVTAFQIQ